MLLLIIPTIDRFLRSGLPASRDANDVRDMMIKKMLVIREETIRVFSLSVVRNACWFLGGKVRIL